MCIAFALLLAAGGAGAQSLSSAPLPIDLSQGLGEHIPLTTTSFLLWTWSGSREQGLDGSCSLRSAERVLHLVEDLHGEVRLTPIAVPQVSFVDYNHPPYFARLSATRVLLRQRGDDGTWGTPDDGVYLLDDLGGENRVVAIPLGASPGPPVRLDDSTAALVLETPAEGSRVRSLVVLSELGGDFRTTVVPAPGPDRDFVYGGPLPLGARSLLVATPNEGFHFVRLGNEPELTYVPLRGRRGAILPLTANSFLALAVGEDPDSGTDDLAYLLRDLGGTNQRIELATPEAAALEPLTRLSPDRVLLRTHGIDRTLGTADDGVLLLDALSTSPTVTAIPVPRLKSHIAALALGPDLAAIATGGADDSSGPEDGVTVLSGLGTTNTATRVVVGPLSRLGNVSQPLRLGPASLALIAFGEDGFWPTVDDELVVITDVGAANDVDRVVVGRLRRRPVALAPAGALAITEGGDHLPATRDDAVLVLSGAGTSLAATLLELGHLQAPSSFAWSDARWDPTLGNGTAVFGSFVFGSSESDGDTWPCEERLHVVRGLPGGIHLEAKEIELRRIPGEGIQIRAVADLELPEPERFAYSDLTVRVGNASQTIPAERIEARKSGFVYRDPRGKRGWLRRLAYDPARGRITIDGLGSGTGAGSTRRHNLILSLESQLFQVAQSLDGKKRAGGLRYRVR